MKISPYACSWIVILMTLFGAESRAQETCPATPEKYGDLEFGDARFAIEENCSRALTQSEQFFLAGVAETLLTNCGLPRDRNGREAVERFTSATSIALWTTSDPTIRDKVDRMTNSKSAFNAGKSMMEKIRCNGPEAALLSRGIGIYLNRTSGSSRFIAGCVEFYTGRFSEKQCQCLAEKLRSVFPDIDQRYFDRQIIKDGIHHSPLIAGYIYWSCDMKDY